MAFTAITALITGSEAVSAALVLSAMAEVGTAMTVVGAVTGSKDLMKLGGIIGLVGGVGGMVNGAMGAAATESAYSGFGAAGRAEVAGGAGASALEAGAAGAAPAAGAEGIGMGAGAGNELGIAPNAPQLQGTTPASAAARSAPSATPASAAATPGGAVAPGTPSAPGAPSGPADVGKAFETNAANGDSFFGKVTSFAKNNKELVNNGVKLIGGALQGAQEADQFDRKLGLEQDQFDYKKAQNANVTNGQLQSRPGIIQLQKV